MVQTKTSHLGKMSKAADIPFDHKPGSSDRIKLRKVKANTYTPGDIMY